MTQNTSFFLLLLLPFFAQAQFEANTQVSIPVFFSETPPFEQSSSLEPIGELSGIALMLFENQDEEDNILLTRQDDPILWMERVGISSKATITFPNNNSLTEIELLLSNNRLTVSLYSNKRVFARGVIAEEQGRFLMRLTGSTEHHRLVQVLLDKVNNYLMRLHFSKKKKVFIRPGFNEDTLNVICGLDTQFDTNFDVIWLNDRLYNRLEREASSVLGLLNSQDTLLGKYHQRVKNSAIVEHTARVSETDSSLMYGSLVVLFEVVGERGYYFLKGGQRYQIAVDYLLRSKENETNFSFEKLMLRSVQSGDFIEMSLMDLTPNHIPIIYVDLINSVIMEDYGTWNIVQVFTVLEDIFSIIELPNERG